MELTDGKTTYGKNKDQIREGVVIRPLNERFVDDLGRVMLKSVSQAYKLRKGETTEYNQKKKVLDKALFLLYNLFKQQEMLMSNEFKDYIRDCEVEIISKINPELGEIYKKHYYSDETDSIYGDDIKHPLSMKWTIWDGVE